MSYRLDGGVDDKIPAGGGAKFPPIEPMDRKGVRRFLERDIREDEDRRTAPKNINGLFVMSVACSAFFRG